MDQYRVAANDSGMMDEFQRFDQMVVSRIDDTNACNTPHNIPTSRRRRHTRDIGGRNLTSSRQSATIVKRRLKRSQPEADIQAATVKEVGLVVQGQVTFRRTESYNSTTNKQLQDALVYVVVNTSVSQDLDLYIYTDSIEVDDVKSKPCGVVVCSNPLATCVNKTDPILKVKGYCQCNPGYKDFSPNNVSFPGEICITPCASNYCANGGQCAQESPFYDPFCKCSHWYFTKEKCSLDLRMVIGIVVSAVIIIALLVATFIYRRRQTACETLSSDTRSDAEFYTSGNYNDAYWTLTRNPEVLQAGDDGRRETPTHGVRGDRQESPVGVYGGLGSPAGVQGRLESPVGVQGRLGSPVGVQGRLGSPVGVQGRQGSTAGVQGRLGSPVMLPRVNLRPNLIESRLFRSEEDLRPTSEAFRDPDHPDWQISQNIPRVRRSFERTTL
ncbi:LWamide neuropeptides-like 1 [Homarus americanus]|uniref:LWamide neuropeptides-like 1 n=1 Tax=Homarus americanus TaxID=6706 RepID=A0A8J5JUJ0_HOMAM|nr:LWamide neuropeptides-like 1 [Homarus americanus]